MHSPHVHDLGDLITTRPFLDLQDGRTALHNAAKWGNLAAVQALLAASAPPQTADNQGLNPLHLAAQQDK